MFGSKRSVLPFLQQQHFFLQQQSVDVVHFSTLFSFEHFAVVAAAVGAVEAVGVTAGADVVEVGAPVAASGW